MASCAEAVHYFLHCNVPSLDGNKNGIPCEDLCVRDRVKGSTEEKKKEMCSLISRAPFFLSDGRMSRGVNPLECGHHQS
jgi:Excalibur calcium-binding domain